MEKVMTIKQALEGIRNADSLNHERWIMLSLALQFMVEQLGCELDKNMSNNYELDKDMSKNSKNWVKRSDSAEDPELPIFGDLAIVGSVDSNGDEEWFYANGKKRIVNSNNVTAEDIFKAHLFKPCTEKEAQDCLATYNIKTKEK